MKRQMHRTIDRIAKKVREKKILDVVEFCTLLDLSPSSFYNYRKFVTSRYSDIIYEDGCYKAIETEDC